MKSQINLTRFQFSLFFLAFLTTGLINAQMGADVDESSIRSSFKDKALEWGACPPFMPDGCNIAVLHGDPTQSNSDILFRVNGNSDIPNHWHNSPERMVLLNGKMEVTYKGEATQTLKVGDYAYGPAKKEHVAKCVSKDPCVLFIGFIDPVDAFEVAD